MPSNRRKLLRPYRPLHPLTCEESEEDFKYMYDLLQIDRRALARFQETKDNPTFKCPPLMAAYCKKHYKCMRFLLEQGAKPGGMNEKKYTTMHFALHDYDFKAVNLLLEYGLDSNFKSSECGSFLSWSLGNEKITKLLLQHGALTDCLHSKDYGDPFYLSNLSKALRRGHCECAKLLLIYNAITDYRKIPIHQSAVYFNSFPHCVIKSSRPIKSIATQKRMFEMLRHFDVDLYQRNKIGLTVLEVLIFQSVGDEESKILTNFLAQLLSQPMSLMSLSRIAIKKCLGREILTKLVTLKELHVLPLGLIDYLHFPDV